MREAEPTHLMRTLPADMEWLNAMEAFERSREPGDDDEEDADTEADDADGDEDDAHTDEREHGGQA